MCHFAIISSTPHIYYTRTYDCIRNDAQLNLLRFPWRLNLTTSNYLYSIFVFCIIRVEKKIATLFFLCTYSYSYLGIVRYVFQKYNKSMIKYGTSENMKNASLKFIVFVV